MKKKICHWYLMEGLDHCQGKICPTIESKQPNTIGHGLNRGGADACTESIIISPDTNTPFAVED